MKLHTLIALCTIATALIASADVPSLINYQGRLTDANGDPVTGSKNFAISIYDAATNGTLLYTEDIGAVTLDDNGVYSFQFGGTGTSNTLVSETVATTDGSSTTFQKVLSNSPVVANSVSVSDGSYTWSQSAGSSNEDQFGVAYSTSSSRVTASYYTGAPAAARTITATYRYETSSITGALSSGAEHWMAISVEGTTQGSRQRVLAVPFALRAGSLSPDAVISNSMIANEAVGSAQLQENAALNNLKESGLSAVSSGGVILSVGENTVLASQGYVRIGQTSFEDEFWQQKNTAFIPAARAVHTAVWTGTEMIIWGGTSSSSNDTLLNSGAVYNPSSNTWRPTSTVNAPPARNFHSAIWTGQEMIIWGGYAGNSTAHNNGGRYNPTTDTWNSVNAVGAPSGRDRHTLIWTGKEMIVWRNDLSGSTAYNPNTDTWRPISDAGSPSNRRDYKAVWTGSKMIIWGGSWNGAQLNTGGCYDPISDTWTTISTTNAPQARSFHTAVWTGTEMIVWGGSNVESGGSLSNYFNNGSRYNPDLNTWTSVTTTLAPSVRAGHSAVWTGSKMLVYGGTNTNRLTDGSSYDPVTDGWTPLKSIGQPSARSNHTAVWTGGEMIIFGGFNNNWNVLNDTSTYMTPKVMYLYQKP